MTQSMVNKVIGVTGACGFIGGAICIELKKRGYRVLGLDLERKDHILSHMDLLTCIDFKHIPTLDRNFSWLECDVIIHCAGTSLVGPSLYDPGIYYHNNVSKTIPLMKWCAKHDKHFLFSSSASVYHTQDLPIKETDSLNPLSPYARSKLMVEQVAKDFNYAYGLKSTIFRYFNACGAVDELHGQDPGASHIFPKLFESKDSFILNGNDFNTRDGTCIRDYIHITDIAIAHVNAIEKECYGIYNLGSNKGYTNLEIINEVNKPYTISNRRPGDADCLIADNTLAKNNLDWEPTYSLTDIVNSLKKWYDSKAYSGLLASSRLINSAAYGN